MKICIYYVDIQWDQNLKSVRIMNERNIKGEPFGMFPGWDPVEISKKKCKK